AAGMGHELACRLFFSSRRRHTRWPRDWSSDVCSSDLITLLRAPDSVERLFNLPLREGGPPFDVAVHFAGSEVVIEAEPAQEEQQIGRASCRERVLNREEVRCFRTKTVNNERHQTRRWT